MACLAAILYSVIVIQSHLTVGPWSSWTRSGSSVDGGDGSDVMGFEALRPGRSEQKPRMHCEVAGGVAGKGR